MFWSLRTCEGIPKIVKKEGKCKASVKVEWFFINSLISHILWERLLYSRLLEVNNTNSSLILCLNRHLVLWSRRMLWWNISSFHFEIHPTGDTTTRIQLSRGRRFWAARVRMAALALLRQLRRAVLPGTPALRVGNSSFSKLEDVLYTYFDRKGRMFAARC